MRHTAIGLAIPTVLLCSCGDAGSSEPASSVLVEPRTVDFGRYSSCDPPGPMPLRIVNRSRVPLAVGDWDSSCRCVTANFGGVTEIAPGEHLDVAVSLAPWGMPGPHGHDLDLLIGSPPARVAVRVAYRMDPEVVVPEPSRRRSENPAGRLEFDAIDGTPFRVLAIDPPLPARFEQAASASPAVEIDWATLDAIAAGEGIDGLDEAQATRVRGLMRRHADGRWRSLWLRATTDHPVCGEVSFGLSNDAPDGGGDR